MPPVEDYCLTGTAKQIEVVSDKIDADDELGMIVLDATAVKHGDLLW